MFIEDIPHSFNMCMSNYVNDIATQSLVGGQLEIKCWILQPGYTHENMYISDGLVDI